MNLSISRSASLRSILIVCSFMAIGSAWADDDPPSRVARLAYISGDVTFAPGGDDQWDQASVNRPLTTGDRLLTNDNSRAAMDIGGGEVRIDSNTGFNFLNLDDRGTQIELSRGTLNWRIDAINDGQNNEVDTPTIAFVASQPGTYKIEVAEDGSYSTISIVQGAGTVYGEGGASYPISGHQAWRFGDSALKDISGMPLAQANDFDLWCSDHDARLSAATNNDYVSPDVVGADALAGNGDWDNDADYGNVWYPNTVAAGWAPYRYGHWAWVAPWGWTWIDDAPWGFAPFHYGRWVYVGNRWGWVPGPRHVRPVYCPAMVAFVGGSAWSVSASSGPPIGWVPLGPRDVYVPWYSGSQRYVTNINITNVTNINRTHINNVYNDYRNNRSDNIRYMNQSAPGGTTVISRDAFSQGRRVNNAQVNIGRAQLEHAPAMQWHELPAGRPNIGLRQSDSPRAPSQEFTRPSVFHNAPPASFAPRDNNRSPAPGNAPNNGGGNFGNDRGNNNPPVTRLSPHDNDGNGNAPPTSFSPGRNRDNNGNASPNQAGAPPQGQQQPQPQSRDNGAGWNSGARNNDTPQVAPQDMPQPAHQPSSSFNTQRPTDNAPRPEQQNIPQAAPAQQPQNRPEQRQTAPAQRPPQNPHPQQLQRHFERPPRPVPERPEHEEKR